MEKIEYGDFHKFIVSLGIASIGLAIVVPWLFLKEHFDFLMETKKIKELTLAAQQILYHKQDVVGKIIKALPWVSLALLLLGLSLIIIGLYRWSRKQKVTDDIEKTNLGIKLKELQKMTAEETENKAVSESVQGGQAIVSDAAVRYDKNAQELDKSAIVNQNYDIKKIVFKSIRNQLKDKYSFRKNQKINSYEFDIIAQSKLADEEDMIVEIRNFKKPGYGFITDTINRVDLANKGYREFLNRKAKSVILFFTDKDIDIDEYKQKAKEEGISLSGDIVIHFIPVGDVEKVDYTRLLVDEGKVRKGNSLICSAIESRQIIRFMYNGSERTVEPFCYGIGSTGSELLRAYQTGCSRESVNSEGWRLFKVDEISSLVLANSHFSADRPYYNPEDKAMASIYCNI